MKFFLPTLFFFIISLNSIAQQILSGTWSNRTGENGSVEDPPEMGVSDFYDMTSWDSGPYQQFRYHSGTNNPNNSNFRMNFRLLFPNDYSQNSNKKYPLIVLLHGLGEAGLRGGASRFPPYNLTENEYLNNDHSLFNGGKQHLDAVNRSADHSQAFPGFVFVPQNGVAWYTPDLENVLVVLDELLQKYEIDPNRIYIHGYSNGGDAVWKLAELRPDLFAAILPISSVISDINVAKITHIPIWHFQGEYDQRPTAQSARQLQQRLKEAGATPRYYEYLNAGHGIWDKAYAEPDFFSWMLGQSKTNIHAYFKETEVCPEDQVNVRLGVSPGFKAYQWKVVSDGAETVFSKGTTNNEITATNYGDYFVRISRVINPSEADWTSWSTPLTIKRKALTPSVEIRASGSTTLPSLDGKTKATLSAPSGYESYRWYKGIGLKKTGSNSITISESGSYTVSVTETDGCASLHSAATVITVNGPENEVETPGNLIANGVSETAVDLLWSDQADNERGYEIYRSTTSGKNYTFIAKVGMNETNFQDKGLNPNTRYYYIIRGVNDKGSSLPSNEAEAITREDALPPSAPRHLTHIVPTINSIQLSWRSSTDNVGVAGYDVFIDNVLTSSTKDTTYLVKGLSRNELYTFTVKARDKAGNLSENSNQITAVTIFEGLAYKYYYGGLWSKVADYEGWQVEKKGFLNNFNIDTEILGGVRPNPQINYFAFDFEGYLYIETAGEYEFRLRAASGSVLILDGKKIVDNDGNHSDTTVTSQRQHYKAGAHPILVKYYDRVEDEALEVFYAGPDTDNKFIPIPDDALTSGKFNYPPPPNAPSELVAKNVSFSQIDLSWKDNSADETGFEIYRSLDSAGIYEKIHTSKAGVVMYDDKDLSPYTTYHYQVKAIGKNGSSDFDKASATTSLSVVFLYFEGNIRDKEIVLKWATESEINNKLFTLERSGDNQHFKVIDTIVGAGNSTEKVEYQLSDTDPRNGTNYYRLKQTDHNQHSGYSSTLAIDIQRSDLMLTAVLYPMPSNGNVLNLLVDPVSFNKMVRLRIINTNGNKYFDDYIGPEKLQVPYNLFANKFYQKGIYILIIEQDGYQLIKKFVVH